MVHDTTTKMRPSGNRYPATVKSEALQNSSSRLFIEHRIAPRVMVKGALASFISISLSDPEFSEGDAVLLNVSLQGCQLDSEQMLPKDQPYQIIVYVPPHPSPILVHKAITRWSQGRIHGVNFVDLTPASKLKLKEVVQHSPAPSWVLSSIRFGMWSGHSFL